MQAILIIDSLNASNPDNCFKSFLSYNGKSHFVFYEKGKRITAYNYYFGAAPSSALDLVNSVIPHEEDIDDVALRAMSLAELQGIRAIIMSKCVKDDWKSSKDGRKLRPEALISIINSTYRISECGIGERSNKSCNGVLPWWSETVSTLSPCSCISPNWIVDPPMSIDRSISIRATAISSLSSPVILLFLK
jgi:hypothetical protein